MVAFAKGAALAGLGSFFRMRIKASMSSQQVRDVP
jgi:hypothetical protein